MPCSFSLMPCLRAMRYARNHSDTPCVGQSGVQGHHKCNEVENAFSNFQSESPSKGADGFTSQWS